MTSQPAFERRDWTYDDYLLLDDDTRYEVMEGVLTLMSAPTTGHQLISGILFTAFRGFVKQYSLGEVFYAPLDVKLNNFNVVQPDLLFIPHERHEIVEHRAVVGAPDLVMEIISPSSIAHDREVKKRIYERFGVREYWIVDPANSTIEVFALQAGRYELVTSAGKTGTVQSRLLPGFSIDVADVFSRQQEPPQ